ncbi:MULTISPECIES: VOC family protein [unclassified Pseudomonas]|uniref:VOC family protein n=1 Tax=Pseudomonas TaxID=286 RepID=UPI0008717917|nr:MULTISPECIES: VOC family protein [unclassified Pseudomonas]SCW99097.1 Catechol 2,3-dioxygenase [Pseudomonas sp. NFACC56-3]SFK87897.1 Catechol 2,3-dioxygenase [Pseudomonas sp. NFACC52]
MSIYTHVAIGTNNIEQSRRFYDAVLGALGLKRLGDMPSSSFYGAEVPELMITAPIDGKPASAGNGITISFASASRAAVDAFHAAALSNGGSCAGKPGPRPVAPTAYGAYVRDPDGNKLATYCYAAQ